jgi:hypothetical protein
VVGTDGTVYYTMTANNDVFPETAGATTVVVVISAAGDVNGVVSAGQGVGGVVLGADGLAYQTTYDPSTNVTAVSVITATVIPGMNSRAIPAIRTAGRICRWRSDRTEPPTR